MNLDFNKQGGTIQSGLIPAIIQDAKTDKVLMLGYMKSLETTPLDKGRNIQ
jgi:phosphoribosyl-AMP cyclohydrolase